METGRRPKTCEEGWSLSLVGSADLRTLASLKGDKSPKAGASSYPPRVVTALGAGGVISGWQELQRLVQDLKVNQ